MHRCCHDRFNGDYRLSRAELASRRPIRDAESEDTAPEALAFLAARGDEELQARIARNHAAPDDLLINLMAGPFESVKLIIMRRFVILGGSEALGRAVLEFQKELGAQLAAAAEAELRQVSERARDEAAVARVAEEPPAVQVVQEAGRAERAARTAHDPSEPAQRRTLPEGAEHRSVSRWAAFIVILTTLLVVLAIWTHLAGR